MSWEFSHDGTVDAIPILLLKSYAMLTVADCTKLSVAFDPCPR